MTMLTEKIKNLNALLPDLPQPPLKNLFDITGVANKEVINSRVLAYFLNLSEDHGLSNLFFESFKEVILKVDSSFRIDDYTGDFQIYLEEETALVSDSDNNQKRIDLLINQELSTITDNMCKEIERLLMKSITKL